MRKRRGGKKMTTALATNNKSNVIPFAKQMKAKKHNPYGVKAPIPFEKMSEKDQRESMESMLDD